MVYYLVAFLHSSVTEWVTLEIVCVDDKAEKAQYNKHQQRVDQQEINRPVREVTETVSDVM